MKSINRTQSTILIFLSLLLGFFGCSTSVFAAKSQGMAAMPPAIVEVTKVSYSTIKDQIMSTGNIVAIPGIIVKPEISGRITNIYFKSGDRVKAQAPLIEIYPDVLKAQLTQNQAEFHLAEVNFTRYSKLYETHTVSRAEYDQAKANLQSLKAKVGQSQAQLNQTIVRAPFEGRLGISQVNLGQFISAGQNIVSLQDLDPIYIDFTVPETYAGHIAVNQDIVLRSDAYPNDTFRGKVSAVDPLINPSTRSISVRGMIPNKDEKLLPGTFSEVTLFISTPKQVIKIPQSAIVYDPSGDYVYLVKNNKAVKTIVTLGARDEKNIIIQSGLKEGDIVVTAGQLKIMQDNAPVIVAPSTPALVDKPKS